MPLHCLNQDGHQRPQPLAADPVRRVPDHDQRLDDRVIVNPAPGLHQSDQTVTGMDHFQMQFGSIDDLFDRYEALAAQGLVPTRSANHGPSTSFYYHDPDGNRVELSVKNYATEAETLAFMQSDAFRKNPAGIDVDPAEYVRRYRGGVSLEELRRIPEPV